MTPYIFSTIQNLDARTQLKMELSAAQYFMYRLPDATGDNEWSCHALARAFARIYSGYGWKVQDGYFGRTGSCHSWLWSEKPAVILDLYPIGGITPFIVEAKHTPWNALYMQHDRTYSQDVRAEWDMMASRAIQAWNGRDRTDENRC